MIDFNPSRYNSNSFFPTSLIPTNGIQVVIYIFLIVCFWFILREVRTWYWKQDKIVSLLEDINESLNKINKKLGEKEIEVTEDVAG